MCEEAPNFTAAMAGNIPGGRRVENSFRVERSTARDFDASLISPLSGSKDQQSMVLTSKGPRDQRMELSVRTAIKFYFVQDMLGFDQPSQAVEWLIEKSEAAIRELPQPSSAISTSQISQYVVANRAAVSSSRVETGEQNSCSQDEYTFSDKDNRHRNLNEQILAARSCRGQRSCTAKTTKIKNNDSIGQGEKKEQRSMASKCRTRETANVVSPKEFRAKARERCRQRTKPKDKIYSQQSGISTGISQKSSMRPHYPTFCLQENTTPPSSMTNETTDANSSSNACLHGSMQLPQDSPPCNQKTPPAEMECSSHCSAPQQEGSSTQSTGMSFL